MNGQADMEVDYKQKYKNLKRKLKFLVYEQECFQEELRRSQRKLLKVSRDKRWLERRRKEVRMRHASNTDNISNCTLSIFAIISHCLTIYSTVPLLNSLRRRSSPGVGLPSSSSSHLSLLSRSGVNPLQSSGSTPYLNTLPFPPEYLAPPAERMKKERKTKAPKHKKETSGKVVAPLAANYPAGPTAPPTSSASFNWVPRQMLSGDAAEEEGESDGDSDRGDDDRGEGEEADLVIDIPNE
uniref:INO80 complex subunit E n=1 Tax=Oncorhynchus mykiss TaxID=8022 RepID=A0A8C7PEQ3_ONCMY